MKNIFSDDQLQQISYGINKGNVPVKFTYLTTHGSQSWETIENERVQKGWFSMDSQLFGRSIECYLHELGNPEEIQVIDIWGGVGVTAESILEGFQEKSVGIHYHTIDMSPIMIARCLERIQRVSDSTWWHLLDIDDGGIGKKIREIKSEHPNVPVLVMILGNTIGNFQSPQALIGQIETGLDICDRIMIGAHVYKPGSEKRILQEYAVEDENIQGILMGTLTAVGIHRDNLVPHISWDTVENQVCGYAQVRQDIETKIWVLRISIQKWHDIRVLESRKFNPERLLLLRWSQRIASLQTDVRGLYSQILLAPGA